MEMMPEIIVFAEPNGSGKSAVTKTAKIINPYINADNIKRATECTDLEAAELAEDMREYVLDCKKSFTFETVMSTDRNLKLLHRAREGLFHQVHLCSDFGCEYKYPPGNEALCLGRPRRSGGEDPFEIYPCARACSGAA